MPSATREIDSDDLLALEAEARAAARETILPFVVHTYPDPWGYRVNWHHRVLAKHLDRFVRGECKRLILALPPRSGKSELVSVGLPAFIFGRDPSAKVISVSHTDDLSKRFSRRLQRIIRSPKYQGLFPKVKLRDDASEEERAAGTWKLTENQFDIVGYGDSYKCSGAMGGIAGYGGNFLLCDDLYKSRKDAQSPTIRRQIWEWFTGDLQYRLEGDGGILIVAHRHHEDDLSGTLIKLMDSEEDAEKWEYVSLPARMDDEPQNEDDPREPKSGDPLWPWLWAGKKDGLTAEEMREKSLLRLRRLEVADVFSFQSLYQQNPSARTGDFFKVERIEIVGAASADAVMTIRAWDKAGTEDGGKRTAGVKMSLLSNGKICVENVTKGQWSSLRREETILDCARSDGKSVTIKIEQEPGSGGKESAEASVRKLMGFSVKLDRPTGDKATRAEPFASQVEAGNVEIIEADWNRDFKEELRHFPFGTYADQVDASAMAFNFLAIAKDKPKTTETPRYRPMKKKWNLR
jgi:predicted phage terminase large subunit-like protein